MHTSEEEQHASFGPIWVSDGKYHVKVGLPNIYTGSPLAAGRTMAGLILKGKCANVFTYATACPHA